MRAEDQRQAFEALTGRSVLRWDGVEMALRATGPDGLPQFSDPTVPFLQLLQLDVTCSDGEAFTIGTAQNDDIWGLSIAPQSQPASATNGFSIFRPRTLPELPIGSVKTVNLKINESSDIMEVLARIGTDDLLLMAGEVYELTTGHLEFVPGDESVLVFRDPRDADRIAWRVPR